MNAFRNVFNLKYVYVLSTRTAFSKSNQVFYGCLGMRGFEFINESNCSSLDPNVFDSVFDGSNLIERHNWCNLSIIFSSTNDQVTMSNSLPSISSDPNDPGGSTPSHLPGGKFNFEGTLIAVIIFHFVAIVGFGVLGVFLFIRIRRRNEMKNLKNSLISVLQQSIYEENEKIQL
jgi:hypothetical protein